jgi:hypothetical protein
MVQPNHMRYMTSLAAELAVQATRVRDLLGDTHWLTDGGHKEFLLIDLLKRHIPAGMIASRGFVISETDVSKRSHEQDVLIVDTMEEAPIFNQGGVIISFPRAVRAALSVKTEMSNSEVKNSVLVLNSVRAVTGPDQDPATIWCAAYYFVEPVNPVLVYDQVARGTAESPVPDTQNGFKRTTPDCHSSPGNYLFKADHGDNNSPTIIRGYNCSGLATALFLGHLLEHLALSRDATQTSFASFSDGGVAKPMDIATRQL